jgi:TolB-like protein
MRNLFQELKHRNVFRVAVAYAVVGWLVVQVADVATESFAAPDWVMKVLILFLLLGLPVAAFLAWAFELTPEGVVRAEDVPANAPKDPRSGKMLNRLTIAALLVIIAWLGWDKLQGPTDADPAPVETAAAVTDKSIAVLPFADFSPDGQQGWFADGLTDEILNALARTRDLRVASRTSSFQYRGTDGDLPKIAAELGVAHILEGSVRRSGDRLRVTAQLIRAADDTHLWSDTFDGTTADSIAIQENIALRIANALKTAMDPDELQRMLSAGTESVEAWELYLQAEGEINSDEPSADHVLALLERAVTIDPGFADAHIGIARLWLSHLNPAQTVRFTQPFPADEARARLYAAIDLAEAHARSETMQAEYQQLRAQFDIRLNDRVDAARRVAEARPEDYESKAYLMGALIAAGDYAAARAIGLEAKQQAMAADDPTSNVFQYLHRVDVPAALEMAEAAMRRPNVQPQTLYQAHRVMLYAGKVAEAALVARQYEDRASDPTSIAMVRVRQACAEGRITDADREFAAYNAVPGQHGAVADNRWLFLQTLGRYEDAIEDVRHLDQGVGLYALSGFLAYTHFDPRPFPNLNARLEAQGIQRPPAAQVAFFCKRD